MLTTLYGKRAPEVLHDRWQVIKFVKDLSIATTANSRGCSVWKPLRGPLRDWPLGLVDARTVDFENDTLPADVVFPTWVTENMQVLYNSNYRWYHLSDQLPNEALIFKSADSDDSLPCGMFLVHTETNVIDLRQHALMPGFAVPELKSQIYLAKALIAEHSCFMQTSKSIQKRLASFSKAFMVTWYEAKEDLITWASTIRLSLLCLSTSLTRVTLHG